MPGSIPGSERFPGGGNGNPLWHSCLENPMDREAWLALVHGITASDRIEIYSIGFISLLDSFGFCYGQMFIYSFGLWHTSFLIK